MKKTNEIKEKRETNVKHYKQKNGEIIAKIYSDSVNYYNKNENRYRQIDNHFKETKTNYQTKYNAFKVKIPKQINRKIYSIEKDDSLIEIDYDTKNNQIEIQKGKEKNESKAIIKQIEENANLEINLKGNKVKSNIILTKKGSSKNYEFFIKTKNLRLVQNTEKKEIEFYALKDNSLQYIIKKPIMFDANNKISEEIFYEIEEANDGFKLIMKADKTWLESKDRTYPITLDPEIILPNENNLITTYESLGNNIQESENIVRFGKKSENGVDTYYRGYFMMNNPLKNTNKTIIKATLKICIDTLSYPSQLFYSVYTVKSPITSNQLPTIDNKPILNNLYPNSQIQSLDITKALINTSFCGVMIKATTETSQTPGYAQLWGSNNENSPILEIAYYEKDSSIKKENSIDYILNEKGTLSVNLLKSAKHFYHSDLSIGPVTFQHIYFDKDKQFGTNTENQQITPNYHMGMSFKNNLQRYIHIPHRKEENLNDDSKILSIETNNELTTFRKKYVYDDGENVHFVDEEQVTKSPEGELSYTVNDKTYDVSVAYYDEQGRIIQLNEKHYDLIKNLGECRSLDKYYRDINEKKCIIKENGDETFNIEVAYLEGNNDYYVDKEYISEDENGVAVYNRSGVNLKVIGYGTKKRKIHKEKYKEKIEDKYYTTFLKFNPIGRKIEAGHNERIIYQEQNYFESLSNELFEEETISIDSMIQELYLRKEELTLKYKDYETIKQDKTLEELEEMYNKLVNENRIMQTEYSEYQLEKEKEELIEEKNKTDDNILLSKKKKQEKINDIDKLLNFNTNNRKILDNQNEIAYLQVLIQETNEEIKNNEIEMYLNQVKDSIDKIEQEIFELEEKLKDYIKIEKTKPIDYMLENNILLGFDFEGKLVQIVKGKQKINLVYEDDYLIKVKNQDDEVLFEVEYQDELIHQIKDYYGRTIDYIYNQQGFLNEVKFPDNTYIKYAFNDYGLYSAQDSYGNILKILTSTNSQIISRYSTIQSISHQNIQTKAEKLIDEETIYFGKEKASLTNSKVNVCYLFDDFGNIISSYETDNQNNTTNAINHFKNDECSYTFYLDETLHNYLKNGNFENGSNDWNVTGSAVSVTNSSVSGSKSLLLKESSGIKKIQQTLTSEELNLNEIHAFMFSGWAKATNASYVSKKQRKLEEEKELDIQSNAKFELKVEILYENNEKETFSSTFDWTNKEWQLCSLPVLIDKNKVVQTITLIADYSYNSGIVLFDNFKLCKANGEFVKYNEDKTIQYTTDFQTRTNYLSYDSRKPTLVEKIDENGNVKSFKYFYGTNQELIKFETSDGLITEYLNDEENKKFTTMVYHKEDPTTKYYYHQQLDEHERIISEKEKEEDFETNYSYYDNILSLLKTQKIGNQTIYYGYDSNNDRCISKSQSINNMDYSLIYGYTNGLLTQVNNNDGLKINYEYDDCNNITKVKINDQLIVQMSTSEEDITYTNNNVSITEKGTIKTIDYFDENEVSIKKIYDKKGNLIESGYIRRGIYSPKIKYYYDEKGQLVTIDDEITLKQSNFSYNDDGLLSSSETDTIETNYSYNQNKLISQLTRNFTDSNSFTYNYAYSYNQNPYLCTSYSYNNFIFNYDYDLLERIKEKKTSYNGNVLLKEKYGYVKDGDQTFNLINHLQVAILNKTKDDYQYVYDKNGNIAEIFENGKLINQYTYDENNRLIKETDAILKQKIKYLYDKNNNILNKTVYDLSTNELIKEDKYQYASNLISDLLVKFNDESFSYDEYGNIKTFRNQTCKFNSFHKINQIGENNFTYNSLGCRTRKNSIYYDYDAQGLLCKEQSNHTIIYHYENNRICSINVDGKDYLFRRNLLQDVTHIYDVDGNLCAMYHYDAWGNHKVYDEFGVENSDVDFIGNINPIRYRGYYFDKETGLYYCNSRYYSPELCRWISADSIDYLDPNNINGLNLYAYCNNDPVNYYDPSGHSALLALGIFALSSLAMWGVSELFGAQIAGGIGSISGGATAISTGISLWAFGPWGIAAGIILMAVGGFTVAFGANEIVDGITGTNYIQEWTGWSDDVYNDVYIGLNVASAVGSIAGTIGMRIAANNILNGIVKNPQKIQKFSTKRFGKIASKSSWNYSPAKNGKGMRAVLNDKSIRFNMNGTRFDAAHFYGNPYWVVSSAALKKLKYLYLF